MNILPVVPVLNASIDVKELLGNNPLRVFEDVAPHKTPYPYAVWSVVTANPENHLDCPANIDHVSFQIVVYDTDQGRAAEIRSVIRAALEPHCYVTGIHPNHFERIADTNIFGRGFDANWFLDRIDGSVKIYNYIGGSKLFIGSQEVMIGKDFDLV